VKEPLETSLNTSQAKSNIELEGQGTSLIPKGQFDQIMSFEILVTSYLLNYFFD
jgi:hypothetical protein